MKSNKRRDIVNFHDPDLDLEGEYGVGIEAGTDTMEAFEEDEGEWQEVVRKNKKGGRQFDSFDRFDGLDEFEGGDEFGEKGTNFGGKNRGRGRGQRFFGPHPPRGPHGALGMRLGNGQAQPSYRGRLEAAGGGRGKGPAWAKG